MKKRERIKRKDNVIFFPGVEERLKDKGLESLQNKKYNEAISFLEEARELDPDHDDILIGLVLAYFEASAFEQAKILAKELLHKGIGDYFQMVDLYLTVLIQLHEYQEIVSTIEALFDEKEIPSEQYDHFLTILQFSKKMADQRNPMMEEDVEQVEEAPLRLNLFSITDLNEQMLLISSLSDKNIRTYIEEIEEYLESESGNPFLKTILLTILKEQEINKEITLKKMSIQKIVNPAQLPEVREQPKEKKILEELAKNLESHDPMLLENITALVKRIFFISYPFELNPENETAWAAAFHQLGQQYLGMETEVRQLAELYHALPLEIEAATEQIERIEKISYPNI
ncbi:tetratricopeptide repeat protein [Neobacillus sp. LXY-1]|uniref:tetratricopeptide repeat protein n=1 Tax=Neobacillus sp. LXY-1 TaxID=3379133 RepID=UPI003EDF0766